MAWRGFSSRHSLTNEDTVESEPAAPRPTPERRLRVTALAPTRSDRPRPVAVLVITDAITLASSV
eukprot:scaffold77397_cov61-Phaeocystis_antarctica.AAC.7